MRPFPVPTRTGWAVCFVVALLDAILIFARDFTVLADGTLLRNIALLALLAAFSAYYARQPNTQRLAVLTSGILYVAAYSIAIVLASYLTAAMNMPLLDATFARADAVLGFDWTAWLAWVNAHPLIGTALAYAYETSMPQVVVAIVLLSLMKRDAALSEYLNLFWMTTVATIILAALLPAAGAYDFLKPAPQLYSNLSPEGGIAHVHQFFGLRDGSLRAINLVELNGLVSFPSFHTALAIITAWAFWTIPWLRFPAISLNAVVILSTPTQGGHYLVDVIGGGVLALFFILLCRPSVRHALAGFLSPRRRFSTVDACNGAESYDGQSIRNRSRQESGEPSAADAAVVSEARG
ncbi:MAG TPA: phosphatase PAP2 family protein [Parvibaculum sp.]|jgi:membrane-associated phospholipid phosphatase